MSNNLEQFKATYITECFELLADMEARLLQLDEDNASTDDLNAIFRCAHSIKGGAGAFGFTQISKFTHILETLLDEMRSGKVMPTKRNVDALLKGYDIMLQLVKAASQGVTLPEGTGNEVAELLKSLTSDLQPSTPTPTPATSLSTSPSTSPNEVICYTITFAPKKNLFLSGNEPLLLLRELASLASTLTIKPDIEAVPALDTLDPEQCTIKWTIDIESIHPEARIREVFEFVIDECELTIEVIGGYSTEASPSSIASTPAAASTPSITPPANAAPSPSKGENKSAMPSAVTSIRVDIDKVDRLVNMVGELVITQSMLFAQTKGLPVEEFAGLLRGIEELSQHSRELQEAVMSVRMQPVKSIFSRMPRIVRDLCEQLGKEIKLETVGENTEVDKTVIEQLGDPLTHMIRNAIDHGIEKPEIRMKKGKPATGKIVLAASHRGGRIILEISDDGAGLNRERVLQKAKDKNLIAQDATLTTQQIDQLIFLPGFSTAEVVSDISGRGVGMDVVKRNIENLGGTIEIQSVPDSGSKFIVSLPLTLAILDGMIVRVGSEQYIIPINNIIETLKPSHQEIRQVTPHSKVINIRGDFIPIIYLADLFHIQDSLHSASDGLLILVENGQERYGLVIDELIGQQQVVIKSLEANSDPIDGISGATILGDGKVSLILDVSKLTSLEKKQDNSQNYKSCA